MSWKYHSISLPWLSVSESFSITVIIECIISALQFDIPDQHQILNKLTSWAFHHGYAMLFTTTIYLFNEKNNTIPFPPSTNSM